MKSILTSCIRLGGAFLLAAPLFSLSADDALARIRQRDRLVVGSDMVFPVMNFKDAATGRSEGFLADLARAFGKRLLGDENKVEFRKTEEKTRFDDLNAGTVDLLVDTIPISKEKSAIVDFSEETFRSGSALLVKKGSPIKGLDDIKAGTRVAWVTANSDVKFIKAKAPGATYVEFEKSADALAALKEGRVDAFTQVVTHLYRAASQNPGYVLVGRFTTKSYRIAIKKGETTLRDEVNAFLAEFRASGDYDRLYNHWFGPYGGADVR
jgi:putative glutamine transport system substrate-binding protein